jgi:CheY-like chemotaxis protein
VTIEVEDTGFGIAAEEIDGLFEAFSQTESGRQAKEGTGLGLAISRNFARLMGGDIRVASERGRGTTFTLEVPLRPTEQLAAEPPPRRVVGLADGQPRWRLLVVDDTAENRLLLTRLLAAVGLETREAANGRQALDLWREWRPDLIWMDLRMPVMDGYEATRRIRAEEREREADGDRSCKIVALTASAFQHDRAEILASGCDDFVAKPFRESTIFEKLAEHLGAAFVYEDLAAGAASAAPGSATGIDRARLEALSVETLAGLRHAVEIGDTEAAEAAVASIRAADEPLAQSLEQLVRGYRFDVIQDALDRLTP